MNGGHGFRPTASTGVGPSWTKAETTFDNVRWTMEHTKLLRDTRERLGKETLTALPRGIITGIW